MKITKLIVLLALCLISSIAHARYTQTCKVKYQTEEGWSKYYTVTVYFYTGEELNEATESYRYNQFNKYAVIFWGEDQATVIKIDGYLCGYDKVDRNCLEYRFNNIKGKDQQNRDWEICTGAYCS